MIIFTLIEYIIDLLFITDLFINFRTIYLNSKTGDVTDNPKTIAWMYIFQGRFFIDLIASIPFEVLILIINGDKIYFKMIKLLKLSRLLRISRLIAYLKTSKTIKSSLKVFTTVSFLLLWVHWLNWLWYFIVNLDETWLPPKNIDSGETNIYSAGKMTIYLSIYWYAAQLIIGADLIPSTDLELIWWALLWLICPVLMGVIIGQFSDLLNDITKRQRQTNEELDIINNWMTALKLPEEMQTRVLNYFDKVKGK